MDIGCGSGLSGEVLTNHGYYWIGLDISKSMLEINKENEEKNNIMRCDMGQGLPFKAGVFDYAISVSAIQWLCNAEKSSHNPVKRLKRFFSTLYQCLVLGARCALQFYPENPQQMELITNCALESGFTGGLQVDFPHSTKAKKYYLFLQAGYTSESLKEAMSAIPKLPNDNSSNEILFQKKEKPTRLKRKDKKRREKFKSVEWINKMKSRQEKQGKIVRRNTKYTGRKRKGRGIV